MSGVDRRYLLTPECVRRNPSYTTPDGESQSAKRRRLARKKKATQRARLRNETCSISAQTCDNAHVYSGEAEGESRVDPFTGVEVVNEVGHSRGFESGLRVSNSVDVVSDGQLASDVTSSGVIVTPEHVRIGLAYATSEVETRASRRSRLMRRLRAKRKLLLLESESPNLTIPTNIGESAITEHMSLETCSGGNVQDVDVTMAEVEVEGHVFDREEVGIHNDLGTAHNVLERDAASNIYVHPILPVQDVDDASYVDPIPTTQDVEDVTLDGVASNTRTHEVLVRSTTTRGRRAVVSESMGAFATPECVRNHPSYKTPEKESRLEKTQRLRRRYQAKRRVWMSQSSLRRARLFEVARSMQTPACHDLDNMEFVCTHCSALRWKSEKDSAFCCMKGKVRLPLMPPLPPTLLRLYTKDDEICIHFRKYIRSYNNSLAFASLGVKVDKSMANMRGGAYTFRVSGRMCHEIGSLLPSMHPSFSQIYLMDGDDAQLSHRLSLNQHLCADVLSLLQSMMMEINPFATSFKNARQVMQENDTIDIRLRIISGCGRVTDNRRYNAPTANEIAILMSLDGNPTDGMRDIVLHSLYDGLQRISQAHSSYDPLHFVLMFPYGTDGWRLGIPHVGGLSTTLHDLEVATEDRDVDGFDEGSDGRHKTVTIREFYSYHLQVRDGYISPIHLGGRLLQEYMCDELAKLVQNRMVYISTNQQKFRREIRSGLVDALGQHTANDVGQRVVLPSSYIGSPRHMNQLYQDAMAVVRVMGSPDLFITMTANPNWPEVKRELKFQQTPGDRPDIVSRVFHLKLQRMIELLKDDGIFGAIIGRLHVVEFQKRGLPHAHILIILEQDSKPRTIADFDSIICAEIPEREADSQLYEIVKSCMLHGPCGSGFPNAPCMKDGRCSKNYPRQYVHETTVSNGYALYRRRNNGISIRSHGIDLDNRWVVPYNRWLSLYFQCHINVEVCVHVRSVKYLYKYVYKGPDMITAKMVNERSEASTCVNEIDNFLNARYFSASEAGWRLFGYSMGAHKHVVMRLAVHLPGQNMMYFNDEDDLQDVLESSTDTTLTKYFDLNASGDQDALSFLYQDMPKGFVYNRRLRTWVRRINTQRIPTIGRMYFVHPSEGERFYLRVLLSNVRGSKSFEDLRSVNGEIMPSFREACRRRLLIDDSGEWLECLQEAALWGTPWQLRLMFATLLLTCAPSDPSDLWKAIEYHLVEDYIQQIEALGCSGNAENSYKFAIDRALCDVEDIMQGAGKSLSNFGFTVPQRSGNVCRVFCEEMFLDESVELAEADIERLNVDQRKIFNRVVVEHVLQKRDGVFFVDGPGGTGKTFLYNVMLAYVRAKGFIALAVASSGIAALLMKGGRTAHSRFKIPPMELHEGSMCNIAKQSDLGRLLMSCRLIVWDEAPMIHRHALECVERSLRDIRSSDVLFGGIPVVLGGDFRQILPVVRRGDRAQVVGASLKHSPIWNSVEVHRLSINMRVLSLEGDISKQKEFVEYLLSVGDGREHSFIHEGVEKICLPQPMCLETEKMDDLIAITFPNIIDNYKNVDFWRGRAILTPLNDDVDILNSRVTEMFPGNAHTFYSADSVVDDDSNNVYPVEFLNTLEPSGCPPHKLVLKEGMIVILLRTIAYENGLCNGTRLIVCKMGRTIIEAEILTGKNIGGRVIITRIPLVPTNSDLPFDFRRLQFPLKPAFAMSINKAQGQTMDFVGLYLPRSVFSHGQLYVALSRVRSDSCVKVLIKGKGGCGHNEEGPKLYTENVVYREIQTCKKEATDSKLQKKDYIFFISEDLDRNIHPQIQRCICSRSKKMVVLTMIFKDF